MGNHNRQWIGGRHVVLEALRAGRWLPLEVAVCQVTGETLEEPLELARQLGLPVKSLDPLAMNRLCRGGEHQGLAMRMPEFPYADLDDLLSTAVRPTALLLLDRIQDSHNFGAILRSAEVFGFDAVIVATKGQSPVNEQVVRSSAGAIHHLTLVRVPSLDDAIQRIQQAGCRVHGAAPEGSTPLAQVDLGRPAALLIGNEGDGITPALLALCDERVRIPQQGQTGSLNAAVSAGILCYELRRQRGR
jgi:23S rRNA (guanosine2251-2'-O)-methyltransferase